MAFKMLQKATREKLKANMKHTSLFQIHYEFLKFLQNIKLLPNNFLWLYHIETLGLVQSLKLSKIAPGQYLDWWLLKNTRYPKPRPTWIRPMWQDNCLFCPKNFQGKYLRKAYVKQWTFTGWLIKLSQSLFVIWK